MNVNLYDALYQVTRRLPRCAMTFGAESSSNDCENADGIAKHVPVYYLDFWQILDTIAEMASIRSP
jgi:hypothetical protein